MAANEVVKGHAGLAVEIPQLVHKYAGNVNLNLALGIFLQILDRNEFFLLLEDAEDQFVIGIKGYSIYRLL